METILLITHSRDHARVQLTVDKLEAQGHQVIRLNVDKYLTEWMISSECTDSQNWNLQLRHLDKIYNASDITAVWYRRLFKFIKDALEELDPSFHQLAYQEAKTTLTGFISSLEDVFIFNHPMQVRLAEIKEWQKKIACQLGFKIPKTCISNDPQVIKAFIQKCNGEVIAKMQASVPIYEGEDELVVMTSKLTADQIDEIDAAQYTPMIFQEFIPKSIEYRFTVVGRKIFTIALDISKNEKYKVDWRRDGDNSDKHWSKAQLPAEIEEKILAYMDAFHLNYGAGDILLGPDGEYYFLEVNPGGEYGWADRIWEDAISTEMAYILSNQVERRSWGGFPSAK